MTRRILIADPSQEFIDKILNAPESSLYTFETAKRGEEAFAKLENFEPDLILIDLLLPEMHGIEILRLVRENPRWKKVGVILASNSLMIQNFHAAVKEGVDYFLSKPIDLGLLYTLFARFFDGTLNPEPFSVETHKAPEIHPYKPRQHDAKSYIKFWGTRGSNPVSGPEYLRFGGNTVCLEIRHGQDLIIIDSGTGIRPLGQVLEQEKPKTIHLFLSHTHWDHVTGFPFFAPIYHSDVELIIWSPVGFEKTTKELFTEMLAYSYFPVRLEDIKAKLTFNDLREGHPVTIGDVTIDSHYAYHPGATLCFKIHLGDKIIGYATDNELFLGYHGSPNAIGPDHPLIKSNQSLIEFFKHCTLLIHEAQYTPAEYQKRVGWGHSSVSNAVLLCKYSSIKEWIVTHHDPSHTDEALLAQWQLHRDILEDCHLSTQVHFAFDGMTLPL